MLVSCTLMFGACNNDIRRFPLAEPMWVDADDFRVFEPIPEEYFSPFAWDGADQMLFRPMSRFFQVDPAGEAVNVNAMDEVPDSSWFTNRTSRAQMSIEDTLRGACTEEPLNPTGPWTITNAKPNGANPGFIIEDAEGRRFLLKFDSVDQPERATAADRMGSLMYYAAGFYVPCNGVVYFERDILQIDDEATSRVEGEEVPMTWDILEPAFEKGETARHPDGRYRAAFSQFLPGRPIGPWRYEGTRGDDPNDVVNHEDRRELRGAYILAAWINHFDSREQNTLAIWMSEDDTDAGYVRHNYIDFGDSFGSLWSWDAISRRLGHASYFDMRFLLEDFATLGLISRPWNDQEYGPSGTTLGYFTTENLDPGRYRPGYPNPAFDKASIRDKAWMARILADITPAQVSAIVDSAEIQNQVTHDQLDEVLLGRRMRLLDYWLRPVSPLTQPVLQPTDTGARVCLRDLAVSSGVVEDWDTRRYWARAWQHTGGSDLEQVEVGALARVAQDRVCVELPNVQSTEEDPAYLIVDVAGVFEGEEPRVARLHLYQLGTGHYRVVGLERPYDLDEPDSRD